MENILGIILIIVIVILVWALIFHLGEKYGGVTFISGPNKIGKAQQVHKSNETDKYLINETKKSNPELIKKAQEQIKRKRYKSTYRNVLSEVEKIKKTEPVWVEKKEKENKKKVEEKSKKIDSYLRKKHNVPEFDEGLKTGKNRIFFELDIKAYCSTKNSKDGVLCESEFTDKELSILNSKEFKSWKEEYLRQTKIQMDNYMFNIGYLMDRELYK